MYNIIQVFRIRYCTKRTPTGVIFRATRKCPTTSTKEFQISTAESESEPQVHKIFFSPVHSRPNLSFTFATCISSQHSSQHSNSCCSSQTLMTVSNPNFCPSSKVIACLLMHNSLYAGTYHSLMAYFFARRIRSVGPASFSSSLMARWRSCENTHLEDRTRTEVHSAVVLRSGSIKLLMGGGESLSQ